MASAAKLNLESLLRARKLDRTLTGALPQPASAVPDDLVPTGLGPLDERLGGGLPRGELSEIAGTRSSGRTSLLFALLASATAAGGLVAVVDPCDTLDPESAAAAGVDLGRMLWVRGDALSPGPQLESPSRNAWASRAREQMGFDRLVERGLKAVNLVLQAGGFDVVALDLVDVPAPAIKRLPFPTWLRLHRVIEGSRTLALLVGEEPIARSAGGVTIALEPRIVARRQPADRGHVLALAGVRGERSRMEQAPPGHAAGAVGEAGRAAGMWAHAGADTRRFLGLSIQARLIRARMADEAPCALTFGASV